MHVAGRLRIPLLMVVSGYLAVGSVQRGWPSVRLRLVANYWLYFVWLTAYFGFYLLVDVLVTEPELPSGFYTLQRYASQIVMPEAPLWFVVAMAVFPFAVWACEKLDVPAWVVIVASVALWAWGTYGDTPDWLGKFLRTFVFFSGGYHARRLVPYLAKLGWASGALLLGAFALMLLIGPKMFDWRLSDFLASVIAIIAALILGPVVFRSGIHTRLMGAIGRRTIEIYVLHAPLIALLMLTLRGRPWLQSFTAARPGDAVFVVASVAVVVGSALVLGHVLRKLPGILRLPVSLETRLRRNTEAGRL